jgi:hypothetical protein
MGVSAGGSAQQEQAGVLGLAVDLRQNCRDLGEQLPTDYFGNAAWWATIIISLQLVGHSQDAASTQSPRLYLAEHAELLTVEGLNWVGGPLAQTGRPR